MYVHYYCYPYVPIQVHNSTPSLRRDDMASLGAGIHNLSLMENSLHYDWDVSGDLDITRTSEFDVPRISSPVTAGVPTLFDYDIDAHTPTPPDYSLLSESPHANSETSEEANLNPGIGDDYLPDLGTNVDSPLDLGTSADPPPGLGSSVDPLQGIGSSVDPSPALTSWAHPP